MVITILDFQVWDASLAHIPHKPTYTLHPSFPVRRVLWRPEYECELAIVSNHEYGANSGAAGDVSADLLDVGVRGEGGLARGRGDAVEIWDVRRGWIAKWAVGGSAMEGGVAGEFVILPFPHMVLFLNREGVLTGDIIDIAFADPHTIWAQHSSGTFSQLDLRHSFKPIDAIPRTSVTWEAGGSLAFLSGRQNRWEVPFDDVYVTLLRLFF
jgi:hypothetical protein